MKVSELEGADVDYWVAKAAGFEPVRQSESAEGDRVCITKVRDSDGMMVSIPMWTFRPSRDWAYGGPLIEREGITVAKCDRTGLWGAEIDVSYCGIVECSVHVMPGTGPTPLVAAMRAYVASKFGDTVPDEAP